MMNFNLKLREDFWITEPEYDYHRKPNQYWEFPILVWYENGNRVMWKEKDVVEWLNAPNLN
jgi:hypothetical protein